MWIAKFILWFTFIELIIFFCFFLAMDLLHLIITIFLLVLFKENGQEELYIQFNWVCFNAARKSVSHHESIAHDVTVDDMLRFRLTKKENHFQRGIQTQVKHNEQTTDHSCQMFKDQFNGLIFRIITWM